MHAIVIIFLFVLSYIIAAVVSCPDLYLTLFAMAAIACMSIFSYELAFIVRPRTGRKWSKWFNVAIFGVALLGGISLLFWGGGSNEYGLHLTNKAEAIITQVEILYEIPEKDYSGIFKISEIDNSEWVGIRMAPPWTIVGYRYNLKGVRHENIIDLPIDPDLLLTLIFHSDGNVESDYR